MKKFEKLVISEFANKFLNGGVGGDSTGDCKVSENTITGGGTVPNDCDYDDSCKESVAATFVGEG